MIWPSTVAPLALLALQGDAPTFNRDIAPLVFEHCTVCHRAGEVAPFPLETYRDVSKRARQLVAVTESRYMPPWPPEPGHQDLRGDRSLTEQELALLVEWVAAGKPEGDPALRPEPPRFPEGWQLGEPDLVVSMEEEFKLAAEGRDVYRNFVIPAPVSETRYVRAVEFRPSNRPVVHHAVLFVDRTGAARGLDAQSAQVGFGGMGAGQMQIPDGQFIGWVPGKAPLPGSDDVAWRLDDNTDLVVQAHMQPTGKREPLRMELGLYFNDQPPTTHPVSIRLASRHIDIAPGDDAYIIEQSYTMPVDAELVGIYPHAHYLGKDLRVLARAPGGEEQTLIRIPDWDFNWQDEYRYARPVALPRGTEIRMRFRYDNSAANPRNPSHPPVRVRFGPESRDEMGEVVLQVVTRPEDRPLLVKDYLRAEVAEDLRFVKRMAAQEPEDAGWQNLAGRYALRLGLTGEAVQFYARLVELTPGNPTPLYNLGRAYADDGQPERAIATFGRVLELRPGHVLAYLERAQLHERAGRPEQALADYRAARERAPGDFRVRAGIADLHLAAGDLAAAAREFEEVLGESPDHIRALRRLAGLRLEQGNAEACLELCHHALRLQPQDSQAYTYLGLALEALGRFGEARDALATAARLVPEDAQVAEHLARLEGQAPPR